MLERKRLSNANEQKALSRIRAALGQAISPVVLWSSGKESTALLHLTLRVRKVPAMWWRLPYMQKKHSHGYWLAKTWDLSLYDAMPLWMEYIQHGTWKEVVHAYGPDPSAVIVMTTGIVPMEDGKPYLCAVGDLLNRPTVPSQGWPFDLMLQGTREAENPYFGKQQKFTSDITDFGDGRRLCNPLYDWSDDDLWGYLKKYKVPYDKVRYLGKNSEVSPDTYRTCCRCLDSQHYGEKVYCPKLKEEIDSVAKPPQEHAATLELMKSKVRHVKYSGLAQREVANHV